MKSTLRAALPLILTVTGFVVMGALVVRRIVTSGGGSFAFGAAAIIYAAWLAWESRVSARELAKDSTDRDRGTMELAALAKYALLFAAVLPNDAPRPIASAAGLALMLLGIAVRAAAITRLGADYSHRIRVPDGPIVTSGPYAVIRHPAYLGTLLAHTGLALVFFSAWSIGALVLLWYPAVIVRTVIEDRCLRAHPDYAAYASRVKTALIAKVI
jgi:protein-S-isoprenylcysteine O-methyltransferase Ste14